ncbi:MAG: DegQ family serine endoprotease [Pseudomonadota bacterium]|nr:DegQ family serine endoprotease [Pseudomonadota bacterium]
MTRVTRNIRLTGLALLLLAGAWGMAIGAGFPDFTALVEEHSAAVVSVDATPGEESRAWPEELPPLPQIPEDSPFHDYFKRFFEQLPHTPRQHPSAMGSGFIISPDGYILTNAHVIDEAEQVSVTLNDRRVFTAQVVGKDAHSDVALLKIEAADLPVAKIGDPGRLKVGQWVLAIGSPFGFNYTATAGIISALGRNLPRDNYVPFIQTDAAVNPGSSGGPLFNLDGEVIGVNSQIYTRTGGYMGVSFAVPIDVAMDVAGQLRTQGRVSRGWLGVMIQEVTPELAQSFGLSLPHGALVGRVFDDSPAASAGLEVGDVIIAFNNAPVTRSAALPPLVGRVRPGSRVPITVVRNGSEQQLEVTIEELPEDPGQQTGTGATPNRLRITVSEIPADQQAGDGTGVLVNDVDEGPGERAGIRPGDIITRINNQPVTGVRQFEELVQGLPAGKPVPFLVQRGDGAQFLAVTIPADG